MRAKIKSVRKINEILLCIFTYIQKSDIFSIYLYFDDDFVLVTLKAKYQNVPIISEFCHMSWVTGSLLANLISKNFWDVHYETPCRYISSPWKRYECLLETLWNSGYPSAHLKTHKTNMRNNFVISSGGKSLLAKTNIWLHHNSNSMLGNYYDQSPFLRIITWTFSAWKSGLWTF